MCSEQTVQQGNYGDGVSHQWHQSVTQVNVLSKQFHTIIFYSIRVETKSTQGEGKWLSRDGFLLLRNRGDKGLNEQVLKEVTLWTTRTVEKYICHDLRR